MALAGLAAGVLDMKEEEEGVSVRKAVGAGRLSYYCMPIVLESLDVAVCKARGVFIARSSVFYNLRVRHCDYFFFYRVFIWWHYRLESGEPLLLALATHDPLGL